MKDWIAKSNGGSWYFTKEVLHGSDDDDHVLGRRVLVATAGNIWNAFWPLVRLMEKKNG